MAVVNKPRPQATPSDSVYALRLGPFTATNSWHCAITITFSQCKLRYTITLITDNHARPYVLLLFIGVRLPFFCVHQVFYLLDLGQVLQRMMRDMRGNYLNHRDYSHSFNNYLHDTEFYHTNISHEVNGERLSVCGVAILCTISEMAICIGAINCLY